MHQIGLRFDPGPKGVIAYSQYPWGHTDFSGLPDSSSHLHCSFLVESNRQETLGNAPALKSTQTTALLGQEQKIQEGQASRAGRGGQRSNFALRPDRAVTGKGVQMHPS